ncbi:MAG: hypothetical protein HDT26_00515 [Subdoligranulum sp.]|nr:hypothetical protein [Subdoligranulum sp.]
MAEEMITQESTQASTPETAQNSADREPRFTQEEVNKIVSKRLAEDRARMDRRDTAALEEREKAIAAKETELACKDYVVQHGYPKELVGILDTSDPEAFGKKADALFTMFDRLPYNQRCPAPPLRSHEPAGGYGPGPLAQAFARGAHKPQGRYTDMIDQYLDLGE